MNATISKAGTMAAAAEWLQAGYDVSLTRLCTLSRHSDVWHSSMSGLPMISEAQNVSIRQRRFQTSGRLYIGIFAIKLGKEEMWELPWRDQAYQYLTEQGGLHVEAGETSYWLYMRNPGFPDDNTEIFERNERISTGLLAGAIVVETAGTPIYGYAENFSPIARFGELTFINQHPELMEALEKAGRLQRRRLY